jgi:ATP/maltotriose-dependent transcriptional regulator MalT
LLDDAREEARASGGRAVQLRVDLTRGRLALASGEPQTAADLLQTVLREADRLGHAVLQTEAGAELAGAQRALGRRRAAEEAVRRALEVADEKSPMAISARLHLMLADLLEERGATTRATEELSRARGQIDRLRAGLDPERRAAFDQLPEVKEIVRRSPA